VLYLFSIWLHILAAIVWIGGMAFFALVIVPVTRREEFRSSAPALIQRTGIRFRSLGWFCIALLALTGIVNLAYQGTGWENIWSGALWHGALGTVLVFKLALFLIIVVLSLLHDFIIGPRATAAGLDNPASPQAMRYSRYARWMGRLNLLLALSAVALGIMLVRGSPW
jgi:putative copper resistance protein D